MIKLTNILKKFIKELYVQSNQISKKLISDKDGATKFWYKDALNVSKDYTNAKIKKIDSSLPDGVGKNYIIVVEQSSIKEEQEDYFNNSPLYTNVSEKDTITIIRGTTPVDDSRANTTGAKRKMSDSEIIAWFTDPDNGTDDEIFYDKFGKKYHPWDLESANIIFKGRTYHL